MKTSIILLLLAFGIVGCQKSELDKSIKAVNHKPDKIKISAHVLEENYKEKHKTIIASVTPQEIYSHHSSMEGGGIYIKVTIFIENGYVKIHQTESMSLKNKNDSENNETTKHTYLLPLHSIKTETVQLKLSNGPIKVTLKKE